MTIIQPSVTFNLQSATTLISTAPHKVLFVGQKVASGTATSGVLVQSIENDNSENTLFGANSMLAGMVRAYKKLNKETRIDAIPLSDAAGVAATGTITFTGTASANGTFVIYVGSRANHKYEISVISADTPTAIAAKVVTAVNADTKVPVTASNVAGVVTFTCDHAGTFGNGIGLQITGTVSGVTPSLVAMASGATDPSVTTLLDVIEDVRYQTIVAPVYARDVIVAELEARFNVTNAVLDGILIISITDTFANLKAAGNAQNSKSLCIHGNKKVTDTLYKGSALFEIDVNIAAQFAAIRSLRLTDDANISRYNIGTVGSPLDNFGGPAQASKPYFNLPFFNLPIIDAPYVFTQIEIEELFDAGVFVIGNNRTRTNVICGEVVTTYKTDVASNPDITWKFLETVDNGTTQREFFVNNFRARFVQSRLTAGNLVPGRDVVNADVIRTFCTNLYVRLSEADYVLTPAGPEARKKYIEDLVVTLDLENGKVDISMVNRIVVQLREVAATIKLSFDQLG